MEKQPISYPFFTGAYEGLISSIAYTLVSKGLADYSKYDEIKEYFNSEIERIKQAEREYSNKIKA